jgi:hypothetical protein
MIWKILLAWGIVTFQPGQTFYGDSSLYYQRAAVCAIRDITAVPCLLLPPENCPLPIYELTSCKDEVKRGQGTYELTLQDDFLYNSYYMTSGGWVAGKTNKHLNEYDLYKEIQKGNLKFKWGTGTGWQPIKNWFKYKSPIADDLKTVEQQLKEIEDLVDEIIALKEKQEKLEETRQ